MHQTFCVVLSTLLGMVMVRAVGGSEPAKSDGNVERLPPDAARVYAAIKTAQSGEFKWQQIPWLLDLEEGIRLAKKEKRPLLLFVSGDEPLERC